ncbi:MAG: hypothetical protein GDA47_04310 [Rhodospirillales bacterium]|nr:hypothetical protein [Rhodospirillales bacterium]
MLLRIAGGSAFHADGCPAGEGCDLAQSDALAAGPPQQVLHPAALHREVGGQLRADDGIVFDQD